jgi:hypothetical protein
MGNLKGLRQMMIDSNLGNNEDLIPKLKHGKIKI